MAHKRRRNDSTEQKATKAKRTKFHLDSAKLPGIDRAGIVLVTGSNNTGQLGLGPDVVEKTRFVELKLEQLAVDVCAGAMHNVCLLKNGKVWTWGCNDEGALGRATDGNEDAELTPGEVELPGKVVQITAGDSHSAALLEDGRVFAWGTFRDSHGNMGLTLRGNEKLPYEIIKDVHVVKIASGADHLVFLSNVGDIYTCGRGEQGQLGRVTERGSGRNARNGFNNGQIGKLLQPTVISVKPSLRLHFDNIWAGQHGTFAKVADKDDVYVFGLNNYNQLGLKTIGAQYAPKLSPEFSKNTWNIISPDEHHTIALDTKGKTFAIGRKEYGRLGLGDDCQDATQLAAIPALQDKTVVFIASGGVASFAATDKGDLYSWGMGNEGHLGTGDEDDRPTPTLIKSKQLVDRPVFKVGSGSQHAIILASDANNNKNGTA